MRPPMRNNAGTCLGIVCFSSLLLFAASATGQETIEPGERLVFTPPGVTSGTCDAPADTATCFTRDGTGNLELGAFAVGALQSTGVAEMLQQYDFAVEPGFGPRSVLTAQISGSLDVDGRLALVGIGEVSASATLEVLDVTGPAPPMVVETYRVFEREFTAEVAPQVGGGVAVGVSAGVDVGVPHGGSGGVDGGADFGLDVSVAIPSQATNVIDSFDFGFDVLLERGHSYRIQLRTRAIAVGQLGGIAWAQLGSLPTGNRVPKGVEMLMDNGPFSLATFFEAAKEVVGDNPGIPSRTINVNAKQKLKQFQPILDELGGLISFDIEDDFPAFTLSASTDDIFNSLPLPRNVDDIASGLFGFGAPAQTEFDREGLELTQLSVLLESDLHEDVRRLEIERNLARCRRVVSNLLPEASGGRFEEVMFVVQELIEASQDAELDVGNAERLVERAGEKSEKGKFKAAYDNLCRAYRRLR